MAEELQGFFVTLSAKLNKNSFDNMKAEAVDAVEDAQKEIDSVEKKRLKASDKNYKDYFGNVAKYSRAAVSQVFKLGLGVTSVTGAVLALNKIGGTEARTLGQAQTAGVGGRDYAVAENAFKLLGVGAESIQALNDEFLKLRNGQAFNIDWANLMRLGFDDAEKLMNLTSTERIKAIMQAGERYVGSTQYDEQGNLLNRRQRQERAIFMLNSISAGLGDAFSKLAGRTVDSVFASAAARTQQTEAMQMRGARLNSAVTGLGIRLQEGAYALADYLMPSITKLINKIDSFLGDRDNIKAVGDGIKKIAGTLEDIYAGLDKLFGDGKLWQEKQKEKDKQKEVETRKNASEELGKFISGQNMTKGQLRKSLTEFYTGGYGSLPEDAVLRQFNLGAAKVNKQMGKNFVNKLDNFGQLLQMLENKDLREPMLKVLDAGRKKGTQSLMQNININVKSTSPQAAAREIKNELQKTTANGFGEMLNRSYGWSVG